MSDSTTEQRMMQNEIVFRQHNERIQKSFDEVKRIAKEDNQQHLVPDNNVPLHYYCECSDENCLERITLKPSIYNKIHQQRDHFVIVPHHETRKIEQIIGTKADYYVVKKFRLPLEPAAGLQPTDVKNA